MFVVVLVCLSLAVDVVDGAWRLMGEVVDMHRTSRGREGVGGGGEGGAGGRAGEEIERRDGGEGGPYLGRARRNAW